VIGLSNKISEKIITDKTVSSGTGTGEYNATLNGLTAGVTYYARAYATNSKLTGMLSALIRQPPLHLTI
jgi:hypothetical protein